MSVTSGGTAPKSLSIGGSGRVGGFGGDVYDLADGPLAVSSRYQSQIEAESP